jgi:hypothetical protein
VEAWLILVWNSEQLADDGDRQWIRKIIDDI